MRSLPTASTYRYWYVLDGRNNVVAVTDNSGTAVDSYAYDSWGEPLPGLTKQQVMQQFRYKSYWLDDATGWYWFDAGVTDGTHPRQYDPEAMRFMQPDTSSGPFDYAYADDNPINTGSLVAGLGDQLYLSGLTGDGASLLSPQDPCPPEEEGCYPSEVEGVSPRKGIVAAMITWAMGLDKGGIKGSKPGSPAYEYQAEWAGTTEFHAKGGGTEVWADGLDLNEGYLVDVKYIGTNGSSPYVLGSMKEELQNKIIYRKGGPADEIRRYGDVINDPETPVRGLKVITNVKRAVPLFQRLMKEYRVPGVILVRPK